VIVTGEVPAVEPYYAQCAVSVVPLRAGGGTRLKILESMALGRPVVSTTVGCEGLEVRDGEHLLVADEPRTLAAKVVALLQDGDLRCALAARARRLVERRYAWPILGERLMATYDALLAQPVPKM
jgi:glycosyltransferase involved in cell wall biosynthesis